MTCKRCGGSAEDEFCPECTRIREALAAGLAATGRHQLTLLMGQAAAHQCHYCSAQAGTWDHIVARGYGGPDMAENLVPACEPCNNTKAHYKSSCRCAKCVNAWRRWGATYAEMMAR